MPEVKVVPVPYDSDFFNKYTVYFDDQPVDSLRGVYFSREGDKHLINSEAYLFGIDTFVVHISSHETGLGNHSP